jgi:hypothetical protein
VRSEQLKGERELETFFRFVTVSQLPYDPNTAKKCYSPKPDILCNHQFDELVAFELVEICDEDIASAPSRLVDGGVEYIRTADPTGKIIAKKLRCKYKCEQPIELLCYTQGRVVTPGQIISARLRQCASLMRKSSFRKVWLLNSKTVSLIWERR